MKKPLVLAMLLAPLPALAQPAPKPERRTNPATP